MSPFVALLILTGYVILLFVIGILISLTGDKDCLKKVCVGEANLMTNTIDKNVKPCDNFYKFVCGNYEKSFQEKKDIDSIWEVLEKKALWNLVHLLKEQEKYSDDSMLVILKMMYRKCIDVGNIEKEGLNPLLNALTLSGGFPLIGQDIWRINSTKREFIPNAESQGRQNGFTTAGFIEFKVRNLGPELNKSFLFFSIPATLKNGQPNFFRHFEYTKELYRIISGNDTVPEDKIKAINETVNLKLHLMNLTRTEKNCSRIEGDLHNYEKIHLNRKYKLIDSIMYNLKLQSYWINTEKVGFELGFAKYLKDLGDYIKNVDKLTLLNYASIEFIIQATPFLPKKLQNIYNKYLRNEEDKSNKILNNRRLNCAKMINDKLSTLISALYLRKLEYSEAEDKYKDALHFLTRRFKRNLEQLVNSVKWMDHKNKIETIQQVKKITLTTPLPQDVIDGFKNDLEFKYFYEDLCVVETDSTLENYLEFVKFSVGVNLRFIHPWSKEKIVVFQDHYDIFTSQIYFDYERESVVVPLVHLKYPAYDRGLPHYFNYGGIGSKINHEWFKGIGFAKVHFGLKSNEKDWSKSTATKYKKESLCFVDQYNNYIEPLSGKKINDSNCVEENIMDLSALIVSHMSYSEYNKERFFSEPKLPGFEDYSAKQLFFISYASFYCKKHLKAYTQNMTEAELGNFSNEYRVVTSLKNFPDFSRAFDCKKEDKMNPSKKCTMI